MPVAWLGGCPRARGTPRERSLVIVLTGRLDGISKGRGQEAAGPMTVPRAPSLLPLAPRSGMQGTTSDRCGRAGQDGVGCGRQQGGALSLEKGTSRTGSLSQLFVVVVFLSLKLTCSGPLAS